MHSKEFKQFLESAEKDYAADYPLAQSFVQTLLARVRYQEEDNTQPGVTIETLAMDLVTYIGYIEQRLPSEE